MTLVAKVGSLLPSKWLNFRGHKFRKREIAAGVTTPLWQRDAVCSGRVGRDHRKNHAGCKNEASKRGKSQDLLIRNLKQTEEA